MKSPNHLWASLTILAFLGGCSNKDVASCDKPAEAPITSPSTAGAAIPLEAPKVTKRIELEGLRAMLCYVTVPHFKGQRFALGVPETIGCRETQMILNHPEVKERLKWESEGESGILATQWTTEGVISYFARLIPSEDTVDVEMTITNLTKRMWHQVFAFNCVSPVRAPDFQDRKMTRTFVSVGGKPVCLADTNRVQNPDLPTFMVYLPNLLKERPPFATSMRVTSKDRVDASWMVSQSDPAGGYVAGTAPEALFLFRNNDFCCVHAAPHFGDIGPGESSTTYSRLYFSQGTLDDFIRRYDRDQAELKPKQKWAREKHSKPRQDSENSDDF